MATPKGYTALQIAKYFIKKSQSDPEKKDLTNLKLQKMLYYAQGWHLANFNKPLFKDAIEAWEYGPAVRSVYQQYKRYGSQPITESVSSEEIKEIDKETRKFLDEAWNVYQKYSGADLVLATHKEKPWLEARESPDLEVSTEAILAHFKSKLENEQST